MKKVSCFKFVIVFLVFSLMLTIGGCGKQETPSSSTASSKPAESAKPAETAKPAEAKKVVAIKFGTNGPGDADYPQIIAAKKFKELVETKTNGAYKVDIYPSAQLGDARTMVEGVQMGTIEMGDIENGPMGRFVPAANLWDLPYLFRDLDHAHKVLDGPIGDSIREMYLAKGIRVLGFNDGGFRYFTNSKRPIKTPDDIKGLKIRVMESEVMISSINAFGASAVPMAFGEVYSGLDQKVVDGQENPLDLIWSMKFYEVQKYLSRSEHFYYPRQYIISEKFFQTLPNEHKTIIQEAAREACKVQRDELEKYTKSMIGKLTGAKMEVNEVDKEAFAKLAKAVYPKFYKTIGNGDEAAGKALIEKVEATK